jgi:hypothetical protein
MESEVEEEDIAPGQNNLSRGQEILSGPTLGPPFMNWPRHILPSLMASFIPVVPAPADSTYEVSILENQSWRDYVCEHAD